MLVNFSKPPHSQTTGKSSADVKIISGSSVLVDDNNMLSTRLLENVLAVILITTFGIKSLFEIKL